MLLNILTSIRHTTYDQNLRIDLCRTIAIPLKHANKNKITFIII
jgi:hypothetical protein